MYEKAIYMPRKIKVTDLSTKEYDDYEYIKLFKNNMN